MTSVDARAVDLGASPRPARQGLRTAAWIVALASALALLVYLSHVLLLLFAGLLVGVLFDALAGRVRRWTGLGDRAALAVVTLAVAAIAVGLGLLVVPRLVHQVSDLTARLPEDWSSAWDRIVTGRRSFAGVQQAVEQVDPSLVEPVVRSLSLTLTVVGEVAIILVVGVYAAARPDLYVGGFVRLLPVGWRDTAREVLHEVGHQLRRWMLGAALEMASAGVLIGLGLWLLDVPYALGLGLLAGLLELVPNFGPIAAAVPAILISFADDGATWWHVVIMYVVVQTVQSYAVQPLIQQHMVEVPPVLLIIVLVAMGWALGALALFTAVPLLVVVMTVVKLVYQRDVLGERVHLAS